MNETIYCCEVIDTSDNKSLAEEYFTAQGFDFSTFYDVEKHEQRHILYFQDEESANLAALNLKEIDPLWTDMGISFSKPKVFSINKEEWSEIWKKYFKIQHVTDRVVIKPTWLEYTRENKDQVVIELDPGMSFGTGRHATTRFCLKMLDKLSSKFPETASVIDAGCGSGILTIGAYKLGFQNLTAFDNDPGCLITTRKNLELNNIDPESITLEEQGLSDASGQQYDIVIANIMAHILVDNRKILKGLMKYDGYLILAGILTGEYCELRKKFEEIGLKEVESLTEDEWTGGMFH